MKIINNTCKDVLPALLNKTKITTIRTAFKKVQVVDDLKLHSVSKTKEGIKSCVIEEKSHFEIVEKPCKYKVGEIYEMQWDKNSETNYYCKQCETVSHEKCERGDMFTKDLGKIKITKIEKIRFGKHNGIFYLEEKYLKDKKAYTNTDLNLMAKNDGFESSDAMFNYLDNADLNKPKDFWIMSFEWVKK